MKESNENIQYFSTGDDGTIIKIVVCAAIFHVVVVAIFAALHFVDFKQEPEMIPVKRKSSTVWTCCSASPTKSLRRRWS